MTAVDGYWPLEVYITLAVNYFYVIFSFIAEKLIFGSMNGCMMHMVNEY